ncbi:MAG TPA: TIGR00268 family protein, partial [Planctomycetota bacterium]|nr:TIGR00268 family protein [Planctomycetota bacterium]
ARIERAESVLRELGFRQFRVRHHDTVARVEVAPGELARAFEQRETIGRGLQAAGYAFVALDVFGYRSGAMNDLLVK